MMERIFEWPLKQRDESNLNAADLATSA